MELKDYGDSTGIHQVDGVNGNCFIIVRDELTLIDTGMPKNSTKIVKYIQDILKRKPTDIKTIVLTHFHIDHVGDAGDLKKLSGAKVAIHEADADYVTGRKTPPVPGGIMGMIFKVLIPLFFGSRPVEPDINSTTVTPSLVSPSFIHQDIHREVFVFLIRHQKFCLLGIY